MADPSSISAELRQALRSMPDEMAVAVLLDAIAQKPVHVQQAIAVRVIDALKPTMFGAQIVDALPREVEEGRRTYSVYPYARPTAGAATVVIAANELDEPHVLLGKRGEYWILPAGFMDPQEPTSVTGIRVKDTKARDAYEMDVLSGNAAPRRETIQVQTQETKPHDAHLQATAVREVREEAGLRLDPQALRLVESYTDNRAPNGNSYQQQINIYLSDMRSLQNLPLLKEGSDLSPVRWVPLARITSHGETVDGPIRPNDAGFLTQALKMMRKKDLEPFGFTPEGMALVLGRERPKNEFGPEAIAWHAAARAKAKSMSALLRSQTTAVTSVNPPGRTSSRERS